VSIFDIMFIGQPSNYVPNLINIATVKFLYPGVLGHPQNAKKRVFPDDFRPRYFGPFYPYPVYIWWSVRGHIPPVLLPAERSEAGGRVHPEWHAKVA